MINMEKNKIYKQTEEHRRKLSLANKDTNKGRSPWNKGIKMLPMSEEHKIKIKKTMLERKISPKVKLQKGYKMPEEWKKKISEDKKINNPQGFKIGNKIRPLHRGHSEETKKKLSTTRKERMKQGLIVLSPSAGFQKGHEVMPEWIEKCRKANIGRKPSDKWKEWRSKYVFPKKDTSIEVKMQNFLKQLNIEFYTHQYVREIEHAYQCDILIPVQSGIKQKTIIECYGVYWHNYPYANEKDILRCNELRDNGWRVLVFWENEIKLIEITDLQNKLGGEYFGRFA